MGKFLRWLFGLLLGIVIVAAAASFVYMRASNTFYSAEFALGTPVMMIGLIGKLVATYLLFQTFPTTNKWVRLVFSTMFLIFCFYRYIGEWVIVVEIILFIMRLKHIDNRAHKTTSLGFTALIFVVVLVFTLANMWLYKAPLQLIQIVALGALALQLVLHLIVFEFRGYVKSKFGGSTATTAVHTTTTTTTVTTTTPAPRILKFPGRGTKPAATTKDPWDFDED